MNKISPKTNLIKDHTRTPISKGKDAKVQLKIAKKPWEREIEMDFDTAKAVINSPNKRKNKSIDGPVAKRPKLTERASQKLLIDALNTNDHELTHQKNLLLFIVSSKTKEIAELKRARQQLQLDIDPYAANYEEPMHIEGGNDIHMHIDFPLIDALDNNINEQEQFLDHLNEQNDALNNLTKENEQLKNSVDQNSASSELEKKITESPADISELKQKILDLTTLSNNKSKEAETIILDLMKERHELKKDNTSLNETLQLIKNESAQLQSIIDQQKQTITTLTQANQQLEMQVQDTVPRKILKSVRNIPSPIKAGMILAAAYVGFNNPQFIMPVIDYVARQFPSDYAQQLAQMAIENAPTLAGLVPTLTLATGFRSIQQRGVQQL